MTFYDLYTLTTGILFLVPSFSEFFFFVDFFLNCCCRLRNVMFMTLLGLWCSLFSVASTETITPSTNQPPLPYSGPEQKRVNFPPFFLRSSSCLDLIILVSGFFHSEESILSERWCCSPSRILFVPFYFVYTGGH